MHLSQFFNNIFKLSHRNITSNYTVYGETGRCPLEIVIKQKMLSYWNYLLINDRKLSTIMYKLMFEYINPILKRSNGLWTENLLWTNVD